MGRSERVGRCGRCVSLSRDAFRAAWLGLALLVGAGCQVSANIDGKPCPCARGFSCVANRCTAGPAQETPDGSAMSGLDDGVIRGSSSFADRIADDFLAGTFDQTEWGGESVRLVAGAREGTFTSRVIDASQEVEWASLEWSPRGPYGKALPSNGGQESGYARDAVDMRDNVLLVHFDSEQSIAPGETLRDDSGTGNDVTAGGNESLDVVPGPVHQAAKSTTSNYMFSRAGDSFQFGTGDYTWALWVRTTQVCEEFETLASNRVYIGVEGLEDPPSTRTHLWLGCRQKCNLSAPGGLAGGVSSSPQGTTPGAVYCSANQVNDGTWHHLTLTKTNHDQATVRLYFDGVLESTESVSYSDPFRVNPNEEFAIGAFSGGNFSAEIETDEVAVFRRALSDAEAAALFRRGALHLTFQIRICGDARCANDPPFLGPDGTRDSVFEDSPNTPSVATLASIANFRGRFIQYRATLRSTTDNASPEFDEVVLTIP